MEQKTVIVNIYNFIRMAHTEPTRFIQDDFATIRNQILTVKQYGFPGTYALKYDALMNPQYQQLLKTCLDDTDEISAWWEISSELCARAGVRFRDSSQEDHYDDRVDSAYAIGYTPEERKKLVDAYMADFYAVFGRYPQSIGSWVLDSVTMGYAAEQYHIDACAICRDQMGTDGFTLWGGWPNGMYYPSRKNENIPAQTEENQIPIPVFRLLGPDPIYNFEADVRSGLAGVYTLEPSWVIGRDREWIGWFFGCLTQEDALGVGYAHVGQENNFLWENIAPGFAPQLDELKRLSGEGKLRVETMAESARWFRGKYRATPPMTFQASHDWNRENDLSTQWYASAAYRVSFLGEQDHLRIRDCFLYDEEYPSRYLTAPMKGTKSLFDALPVLFPQIWMHGKRPFIRLLDGKGQEPAGQVRYRSLDPFTARAELLGADGTLLAGFTMHPDRRELEGEYSLVFDVLPVFSAQDGNRITMTHEDFSYSFRVEAGRIAHADVDGVHLTPENGHLVLRVGNNVEPEMVYSREYLRDPAPFDGILSVSPAPKLPIPPFAPELHPKDHVFPWGQPGEVTITCRDTGVIRYTLDGTDPGEDAPVYSGPIPITGPCTLRARLFGEDGRVSAAAQGDYRFCLLDLELESTTVLDDRPVFHGKGMTDLLSGNRAECDFISGDWRGTLEDFDITCTLKTPRAGAEIAMGFLSHHRGGIVYPESVTLYVGPDKEHLRLLEQRDLPCEPAKREIAKQDVTFEVHETIGAFRILAKRYARMPRWCTYHGTETVFTMADALMVTPEDE